MAADIMIELNSNDLNEFRRDFGELMRVYFGIGKEYSELSADIDSYIRQFKDIVNLFNKKYKDIAIKLRKTTEELQLRIFLKEKGVKDVFIKVASKLNGLKAIGSDDFGKAKIEEADKFSKELDKVKNKLFISYFEQEVGLGSVFLENYTKNMVELHYGDEIRNDRSPEFKLCSYYAVKNGAGNIDVYGKLSGVGFTEKPILDKVRNFLKKFDPRIEE